MEISNVFLHCQKVLNAEIFTDVALYVCTSYLIQMVNVGFGLKW